jgi:YgiT-type zinc finger domain-containing protein
MKKAPSFCPICSGSVKPGKTTFSVDLQYGLVVVRNVPAHVCEQCGEEWIDDTQAARLEEIVQRARQHKLQLEVLSLS